MPISTFRNSIVLRHMRRGCKASDTVFSKKGSKFEVLTTIVCVEMFNGFVKLIFDVIVKINENSFNIRFMFKGEEPSELGEMINENNIKAITSDKFY